MTGSYKLRQASSVLRGAPLLLSGVLVVSACGEGKQSTAAQVDASVDAAQADAGDPGIEAFDDGVFKRMDGTVVGPNGAELYRPLAADAPAMEGEGQACEYSLQCGAFQICVDNACLRHERIRPDEIEYGPLRTLPLADAARMGYEFEDLGLRELFGWSAPGPLGQRLLWGQRGFRIPGGTFRCDLWELGPFGLKRRGIADAQCGAAALSTRGSFVGLVLKDKSSLWAVWQDPDGSERFRVDVTASLELLDLGGWPYLATSAVFDGDAVVFSVELAPLDQAARPADPVANMTQRVAFLRVEPEGAVTLLRFGGEASVAGSRGWLVRDSKGLQALLLAPYRKVVMAVEPADAALAGLDLLVLETGERTTLFDDRAAASRYWQTEPLSWVLAVDENVQCHTTFLSADKVSELLTRPGCESDVSGEYPYAPYELGMPFLGHTSFLGAGDAHHLSTTRVPFGPYRDFEMQDANGAPLGDDQVRNYAHALSRFGRTREIMNRTFNEYPIRRRSGL